MTATKMAPRFSDLREADARALLARNHVGRLAFSYRDRVDIQPIHYVYDNEWLLGRTGIGSKLVMLAHHPWCAFEVDEVHGAFHWDSVVVHGSFTLLDPKLGSSDLYQRAVERLQQFIPGTFTDDDPAPERVIPFAVHIDELSGRSARPRGES
jgi:nitroimidazol reductase NimA-like FMN-containing flavoprotein (pyridoxamine 5'-phosphate oxidase superfamily)